jgi:putative ABC transport system substrate-binding protein
MSRRAVALLGLVLLAAPLAAGAQQPARVPLVGYLSPTFPSPTPLAPIPGRPLSINTAYVPQFRQGLRELGYVEGQNIALEFRWAEEQYDRLPALAAELVRLKVDVIVTGGVPAIRAAGDPGCPASDEDDPDRHGAC